MATKRKAVAWLADTTTGVQRVLRTQRDAALFGAALPKALRPAVYPLYKGRAIK